MKAFVEILSCVVRIGPDTDHYGAPFEIAVTIAGNGTKGTIKGVHQPLTLEQLRAGRAALKAVGFKEIEFERPNRTSTFTI